MEVYLCITQSENNAINKVVTTVKKLDSQLILKDDISLYKPTFIVAYDSSMENINYLFVPVWERYYFINNIRPMTGGRYEISCTCDVLQSFKDEILRMNCIIEATQSTGNNLYLPSDIWVRNVKAKTDIINFPNGLLDTGEYILITAGG